MIIRNMGLDKYQVKRIIYEKIDSDPDLKYYIDNDFVTKLVDLLIDGISEVIEENNKDLIDKLFHNLRR